MKDGHAAPADSVSSTATSKNVRDTKRELQRFVGRNPVLFSAVCRIKRDRRCVRRDTHLVIEGYPRSANTFSVWAFKQAQREEFRVAHHLHYPAQVVCAARWRIPTIVLIREPEDAITSWLIRDPQPMDRAIEHYVSFYKAVAAHRNACVLASFEEVTTDYGAILERVNQKFGTSFSTFSHTEENVNRVYSRIEEMHKKRNAGGISETRIARPSAAKTEHKSRIKPALRAPGRKALLSEATAIYEYLLRQ
ncbi:hypothetical protein GBA63_18305 [Rubrobacter tropicus]|uniref:Sulfotransferase domain-containing protein n=1 Tax=Rubrobacter tropicus TaxID=2653851 RepID=A0A6G8QCY4_9ACTN|nr:hypothetical protein [Rubrobacter tropicus]QIN84374.1 hypothetical protein GBA63_18305 [Rubrobacter tropicus]